MIKRVLGAVAMLLITTTSVYAAETCGGYTSKGNPFPCCDNNGNGKTGDSIDGNCTWWAWKEAKDNWGAAPPVTGGPSSWVSQAKKNSKYKVSSTPAKKTIAVSSSHVAWVTDVTKRMVYDKKKKKTVDSGKKDVVVKEMNCGPGRSWASGAKSATYPAEKFEYIVKK